MPSTCPKCRAVIEEDEICCAQVRYTWRCKSCFKLTSGLAMKYGKCFLCGGDLEVIPNRDLGDTTRFWIAKWWSYPGTRTGCSPTGSSAASRWERRKA